MSDSIKPWDWHYRVGFDHSLAEHIRGVIKALGSQPESSLLSEQLTFFSSMISIAALCDAVEEAPGKIESFLAAIEHHQLLHLPAVLSQHLTDRVSQLSVPLSAKKEMNHLIKAAENSVFENHHETIFCPVFGAGLDHLISKQIASMPSPLVDKIIPRNALKSTVHHLLDRLMAQSIPEGFEEVKDIKFEVVVKEGLGFAEYWPAELLEHTQNQLIIFDNPEQLKQGALQATLVHEVLGHGFFYFLKEKSNAQLLDHGAMCLIEGWATWCEWHILSTPFSQAFRAARLAGLRWFHEKDTGKLLHGIAEDMRKLGYAEEIVQSTLLYYFQYPGFSFSYTLGALWFENKFKEVSVDTFFQQLKQRCWGDFFLVWE
ncbi:MAG: hypothetical protein V4525_08690 [Pseudomonadota bacterium]